MKKERLYETKEFAQSKIRDIVVRTVLNSPADSENERDKNKMEPNVYLYTVLIDNWF